MLRDLFLYLLGGVTFLPLCVLVFLVYEQPEGEPGEGPDGTVPASQPPLTPHAQKAAQTLLTQQQAREAERKATSSGSRDDTKVLASWVIVKNSSRTLPRKSDVCFTGTEAVARRPSATPSGTTRTTTRRPRQMGHVRNAVI